MPRSVENFSKPRSIRHGRAEREQEEVEYWTTNYLITHYLPQAQGRGRSVVRVGRSLGRRIGCPEGHCDTRSRIMQDRILSIGGRVDAPLEIPRIFFLRRDLECIRSRYLEKSFSRSRRYFEKVRVALFFISEFLSIEFERPPTTYPW